MRKNLPANPKQTCAHCGQGIIYFGRRELLEQVAAWENDLELATRSSGSTLCDAACGVLQRARQILASNAGVCVGCARKHGTTAPPPARQVPLFEGST